MTPIDIRPADLETVRRILQEHVPSLEVRAFGSRVAWNARETSDLDVALMTDEALTVAQMADLRAAFSAADLPFRVDVVDWASTSEVFRRVVEAEYSIVARGRNRARMSTHKDANGPRRSVPAKPHEPHHETKRFGDLFSEPPRNGLTRPKAMRGFGTKMVNMGELFAHARLDNVPMDRVPLSESEAGRFLLERGDLLFARQSLVLEGAGKCSLFVGDDEPVTFESHVTRVRLDQRIASPSYYFYYLRSHHGRSVIRAIVEQGAGASGIRGSDLVALDVLWKPLPEQRTIAHVLGTLDDKIELNRRMNATLEAMARALFRSWFVDFDPVRAKMEGRDAELPKDIADLFPDRLVDSELGEIPENWDVSEIGSEVKAVGGGTPSTKEPIYWNGGRHCWATPKDLSKLSSPVLLGTDRKITDAGVRKISSGLLPRGTVLLSSRAPIGYLAITEVPTAVNQGFIAMICQKRLPALYVLSWCHENLERIKDVSGGSTFAEISKQTFRPFPVVVPPKRVLGVYDEASRSLHGRVVSNTRESGLLASLRDALLPKLVSGELRVNGLEPPNGHDGLPAAVEAHGG